MSTNVMTSFRFGVFLVHLLARGWREWFFDSDPSLIICHIDISTERYNSIV